MPNITIMVVGESHTDPTAPQLILQLLRTLQENGMGVLVCDEYPKDYALRECYELEERTKSGCAPLVVDLQLNSMKQPIAGATEPMFKLEQKEAIRSKIATVFNFTVAEADTVALGIIHARNTAQWLLVLKYLMEHNVPYYSVDVDEKETTALRREIAHGNTDYYDNCEQGRVQGMAERVLSKVDFLEKGGVIILRCGFSHVKRVSVYINDLLKQPTHARLILTHEIGVCAYDVFSPYSQGREHLYECPIDFDELRRLMDAVDYTPLYFGDWQSTGGASVLRSDELDALLQDCVSAYYKTVFCIPAEGWSPENEALITGFDGKVVDRNDSFVKIHVHSDRLKKEIRDQLGIDRKRLTLPSQDQVDSLRRYADITLQEEGGKKFLATFPLSRLEEVERVVNSGKKNQFFPSGGAQGGPPSCGTTALCPAPGL